MSTPSGPPTSSAWRDWRSERNLLLGALPWREYGLLAPHFERVPLATGQVLYEPGDEVTHAYFPDRGVLSLVCSPADARPVEVAMIGREGFVGLAAVRGVATMVTRCMVQAPGEGARIRSEVLAEVALHHRPLRLAVARYAQALFDQVVLCAACNLLHAPAQRCARWLLMIEDRVDGDEFPVTQEFLAYMLGMARQTVSGVSRELEARGLIKQGRGRMRVTDRTRLEALACGCYRAVVDRMRAVLEGSHDVALVGDPGRRTRVPTGPGL